MKSFIKLAVVCVLSAWASVMAIPSNVTLGDGNPLVGYYLSGNSGSETEDVEWLIGYYNGQNLDSQLPALPGTASDQLEIEDEPKEWTFTNTECEYGYLLTKWGRGQDNVDTAVYYLELGESVAVIDPGAGRQGLSHYVVWCAGSNVPDGGATLLLLAVGLACLGIARKR